MRRLVLLAVLALAAVQAHAATPGETVAAFHAALAAGDQARASAMLSAEAMIFEAGHVERSRSEYQARHLADDIAFSKVTTRKVLRHSERVEGPMALVLDETETTGTFQGKSVHALGTETVVLEKRGDAWIIVHVHWSSRKPK